MIVINTHRLIQWLGLALLVALGPCVLAVGGIGSFWPALWSTWLIPLVAMGEFSFHVMIASSQRQVRSLIPTLVIALILVGIRMVCSLIAAALILALRGDALGSTLGALFASLWMGSPIVIVGQLLVLMLLLPVGLHRWAPGFLNQETLGRFVEMERQIRGPGGRPPVTEDLPALAEIPAHHAQAYICSFKDLERYYDKVIGLEGFLVLNSEGLVVWDHLPWNEPGSELAGEICRWILSASRVKGPTESCPRLMALRGADRWTVALPMTGGSLLCLFFTERLTAAEVSQLIPRLVESAQSLFTYRYGDQGLGGGVAQPILRRG